MEKFGSGLEEDALKKLKGKLSFILLKIISL